MCANALDIELDRVLVDTVLFLCSTMRRQENSRVSKVQGGGVCERPQARKLTAILAENCLKNPCGWMLTVVRGERMLHRSRTCDIVLRQSVDDKIAYVVSTAPESHRASVADVGAAAVAAAHRSRSTQRGQGWLGKERSRSPRSLEAAKQRDAILFGRMVSQ